MKKLALTFGLLLFSAGAFAAPEDILDTGNTAWMLMAAAMVMLMTPAGLALFYSGLTQNKAVLNTMGMTYVAFCTGTITWVVIGYTLAFGEGSFIGGFEYFMLNGINVTDVVEGAGIPKLLDVAFQGMFASIAVAIVSGSIIERVRFSTWTLFTVFWVALVYAPICHWVWGSSTFLHGDLDFAGGTVIHINAGVAGLILALLLGKRLRMTEVRRPSSIKLMVLGSALLWFGWFGFNAGSAYGANFIAANAFIVTNIAACAGGLIWLMIEWFIVKKPTLIGIASGAVSGLVGITPAAGYVDVSGALIIGLASGVVGYWGVVKLKEYLGHDDTLDAFGMHGLVGIAGAILTGILANPAVDGGSIGLLYGNPAQVLIQLKAVVVTIVWSAAGTFAVFKAVALFTGGARIHKAQELEGMDIAFHGEHHISIEAHNIGNVTELGINSRDRNGKASEAALSASK
jgi:Amt family ammonium transporter